MSESERFFDRHVSRFVDNLREVEHVKELLEEGASGAQVFNKIAYRKGNGKQHASGKPEGKMKNS